MNGWLFPWRSVVLNQSAVVVGEQWMSDSSQQYLQYDTHSSDSQSRTLKRRVDKDFYRLRSILERVPNDVTGVEQQAREV